jgi:hypothetical protein
MNENYSPPRVIVFRRGYRRQFGTVREVSVRIKSETEMRVERALQEEETRLHSDRNILRIPDKRDDLSSSINGCNAIKPDRMRSKTSRRSSSFRSNSFNASMVYKKTQQLSMSIQDSRTKEAAPNGGGYDE